MELEEALRREIVRLHDFFVAWFAGAAPETALETEFGAATAPGFRIVYPEGAAHDRDGVIAALAARRGKAPDLRIEIRNVCLIHEAQDVALASYEEWQWGGGRSETARLSTALMTREAPHLWLHVHETWLPGRAPA